MTAIRAEYLPKLNHLKKAAHQARCAGNPALVISLMIDLVCSESMMLHDMAHASATGIDMLACERFMRRSEIDLLMDCALQAGDRDALLLAEILLQNHHRHMAATVAVGKPHPKSGTAEG